ncbi:MAG: hypothetical protein AVDCRST_MAG01-01-275 [uncultured Rubrobacteraceae bacterium]|uniref:Alkaline phosphatase n=1 Tax=uncultured Rubrobacteraceae bacterium TaxID=349277 RepID=A0A6J4NJG4_9ACTN|nr:MAG: hypothetical protein AVDCRST_MAG01-01-275 [uncultured Rubrobacteraceae bacterium]
MQRLALLACAVLLVAGAATLVPKALLAYRSAVYVLGHANDPPGGPYLVAFGREGPDEMRGGPGNDLLASEGPWGQYPEGYPPDRLSGGAGDDFLDAVSWPDSSADTLECGTGEDAVVADPRDDVDGDCERVKRVDLGLIPSIGDPLPEFPPEVGLREYGPNPYSGRSSPE